MFIHANAVLLVAVFYFSNPSLTHAEDAKARAFRMQKHNMLWEQAKKMLGDGPKLENLYRQLGKLDRLSLKLKHLEGEETEDAKMMEANAKEMYLDILNTYGLATNEAGNEGHNHIKAKFSDKVDKLWQKAVQSGKFSSDELGGLEKEFKHHEKRIEEYRQIADKIVAHDEISDNDIRRLDKMPESDMKELRKELKKKHNHLSSNFEDLSEKIKKRVADVEDDFTDSRVLEIWEQAKKSNFPNKELESIKQELKHFQIRIDKHNYWKDRQAKWKDDLNNGEFPEPSHYETLQSKVKEQARLVKKYHKTMLDMVQSKDEL